MGNLCQLISDIEYTSSNNSSLFSSIFEKHVYFLYLFSHGDNKNIYAHFKVHFSFVLFNFIWKVSKSCIIFDSLLYGIEILRKYEGKLMWNSAQYVVNIIG